MTEHPEQSSHIAVMNQGIALAHAHEDVDNAIAETLLALRDLAATYEEQRHGAMPEQFRLLQMWLHAWEEQHGDGPY